MHDYGTPQTLPCPGAGRTDPISQPGRFPHSATRSGGACQTRAVVGGRAKQYPDRPSSALEKCHRRQVAAAFRGAPFGRALCPRSIEGEQVATLLKLKLTLSRKLAGSTHWSIRQAAHASGISRSTVHCLFQTFALQPHRSRSFKLSTDPFFIEKVCDIVGLYLNPPDPQTPQGTHLAGTATPLSHALHPDLFLLA